MVKAMGYLAASLLTYVFGTCEVVITDEFKAVIYPIYLLHFVVLFH